MIRNTFSILLLVFALLIPTFAVAAPWATYTGIDDCGAGEACHRSQNSDGTFQTSMDARESSGGLVNPLGDVDSLEELVVIVLRGVVQIGAILLVLALVWVGFLFVFAQGNEEKIRSARQALLWTVVGGLLLLGAEAIALLIQSTIQGL